MPTILEYLTLAHFLIGKDLLSLPTEPKPCNPTPTLETSSKVDAALMAHIVNELLVNTVTTIHVETKGRQFRGRHSRND